MTYGYYPGCSLEGISSEYDISTRNLFDVLSIEIEDVPDWICCGTLAAPSMSHLLGLASPLWNVAQAKKAGFQKVIAPCSACVYHFKNAAKSVAKDIALNEQVEKVLEMPLDDPPDMIHPLEILSTDAYESVIKSAVKFDLSDLKIVCYYGCHISRPAETMRFDDPEHPQSMDNLMNWIGVQVLDWQCKVDCCGAHFSMIKPEIMVDLCEKLISSALEAGADAIVVACPMCHANLDTRQDVISQRLGKEINIPIIYFSQVLGYALGVEINKLGFKKHLVDPIPLILEKCHIRREQADQFVGSMEIKL